MSTETLSPPEFDLTAQWKLHDQVEIRPERFGALLYHFGTRRLSFVKSPRLLSVLESLDEATSAQDALTRAGVTEAETQTYVRALETLAGSTMICPTS